MPNTKYLDLKINNESVDLSQADQEGIEVSYVLEEPENFEQIQSDTSYGITLPASKKNDQVFNTFHNPSVEDLTPGQQFRQWMPAILNVNGTVPILIGSARLNSATYKEKPESYNLELQGGNGEWGIAGQNLTLWDCVSATPHTFDVATIEQSWRRAAVGGYDADEDHDFVYAPVRYRQPFQYTQANGKHIGHDDTVSIYMLRPSLSIYWMLYRGFKALGLSINSVFLNTAYFRRMVMPWTWGDFFDINSQLTEGLTFKAAGIIPPTPPPTYTSGVYYTGPVAVTAPWTVWNTTAAAGTGYIVTGPIFGGGTAYFDLSNTEPPNGFDNYGLYSFNTGTGIMSYNFTPPANLAPYIGSNVTLNFKLSLYVGIKTDPGSQCDMQIEVYINGVLQSSNSILPGGPIVSNEYPCPGIGAVYPFVKNNMTPTDYQFAVSGCNSGDLIEFKLKYVQSGGTAATVVVMSSGHLNTNPADTGASPWQYNPVTEKWQNLQGDITKAAWQEMYSTLQMVGIQIELGTPVNFKQYDTFRNYRFFDLLNGLVDTFDLQVKSDPINQSVTIEPRHAVDIPDYDNNGDFIGNITVDGYLSSVKVNDWTKKQDFTGESIVENFANTERQIDFQFKPDGADGGQNIYTARYKGRYAPSITKYKFQNDAVENGLIAAVPGASRYMLPNVYATGNKQKTNRFFSATMHYFHAPWNNITGLGSPAPQLIAIFPENINDSSASAVTQAFEPKIAYYAGLKDTAGYGGWRWIGDPASPYTDGGSPSAIGFSLPYMFSVNYQQKAIILGQNNYPVLSYSDQLVYDSSGNPIIMPGLMRKFFLQRLAIMRNGQILNANLRLNLNDVCDWLHRTAVLIDKNLYGVIEIQGYRPISDEACKVKLWKIIPAQQVDLDNSYPSATSISTNPLVLAQYDLKYAPLTLFITDIPQV